MAFDGLCLKAISYELKQLIGYKIDKVYEPDKNNIVLGLYGERTKCALNINIDSKFYRINLTTHPKPNPIHSLNYCMLLRKHIIGYKIKNIITSGLERLISFELEPFDPYDKNIKFLIIELMGKHSNIILTDKNQIIIDSIRHTNISKNSYRNIYPKEHYLPPKTEKLDFEKLKSSEEFYNIIAPKLDNVSITKAIADTFTGFSLNQIDYSLNSLNVDNQNKEQIKQCYNIINKLVTETTNSNVQFEKLDEENFVLSINKNSTEAFALNFFIDDFYFKKESASIFLTYRNNVLKLISSQLKKYNKRLININQKLTDCDNMEKYKLYGELLTANLYQYNNQHIDEIKLFNYYTNEDIVFPLEKRYSVNENCKRYFKKYNKLKNALDIVQKQKEETIAELQYIESIIYELENATNIEDVDNIYNEISENVIFKNTSKKQLNKKAIKNAKKNGNSFAPLVFDINGFSVLVGRNNKENDWLTTKKASSTDLWFHTKDIHGSHVILKTNGNTYIDDSVLVECAKLAAKHSKGKNSANVPVDYTLVKYVKKPNGAKPGMVIYTHNKTLYVTP